MGDGYSIFETTYGWMGIVEGEKGLRRIFLPHDNPENIKATILRVFPDAAEKARALKCASSILGQYFEGESISATVSLDWSGHPNFSVKVWRTAQSIPWGTVRTYKWLSLRIRKPFASRAIGNALGKNPFPILVPCHRVVRSNGQLGGFSGPSGIVLKRKMLEMEGVRFDAKGRVRF
jgi:methylated-DNA-[protein]-cysteine S-methyltransferase